jgi:hypothetical protein
VRYYKNVTCPSQAISSLARNVLNCKDSSDFESLGWGTPNVDEIGKLLPSLFRKQIRREAPHLLEILLPLWPRIAGRNMAQHSQPAFFASGVLTLATDCATWGTQLRHMTEEIRAEINGYLGQPIVRKLRIKTVTQPSLFSSPHPSRGTAPPAPPMGGQAMDTSSIADPEISMALASSYVKYFNRPRR